MAATALRANGKGRREGTGMKPKKAARRWQRGPALSLEMWVVLVLVALLQGGIENGNHVPSTPPARGLSASGNAFSFSSPLPSILLLASAQSFDPLIHAPSENKPRRLSEGFHNDIDDLSVSAGFQHTCGVQKGSDANAEEFGGTLTCWGFNQKGQSAPPAGTFIQVSCGSFHSCALSIDESIKCWGAQGIGSSPEGEFLQVSAGSFHTCAVRKDGYLQCWGKDYEHQVTDTPTSGDFVQVTAGKTHNCAIKSDGSAVCWGSNSRGESQAPEGYQFVQLSASPWHHTCGITIDGEVMCWGADGYGQSGNMPMGLKWNTVSTGRKFSCGILVNGTASCWGQKNEAFGFLSPPEGVTFTQISSGYMHNCGVTTDGVTMCWGQDTGSQSTVPLDFVAA